MALTEEQALKDLSEIELSISKFPFSASGRAQAGSETEGFVKVIASKRDGVILGAQASEMIQEAALAIQTGLTAMELAKVIHPHPTLSESIAEAAMGVDSMMLHFINR